MNIDPTLKSKNVTAVQNQDIGADRASNAPMTAAKMASENNLIALELDSLEKLLPGADAEEQEMVAEAEQAIKDTIMQQETILQQEMELEYQRMELFQQESQIMTQMIGAPEEEQKALGNQLNDIKSMKMSIDMSSANLKMAAAQAKGAYNLAVQSYNQIVKTVNDMTRTREQMQSPSWLQTAATAGENAIRYGVDKVAGALGLGKKVDIPSSQKATALGSAAERVATNMNTRGWCYRGVIHSLREIGVTGLTGGSAYMAANQLAKRNDFQEITGNFSSAAELKNLPAGAVVVWDRGVAGMSAQHGHISISLGDGREASDCIRPQLGVNSNAKPGQFRVFMPLG
jgi:hypothetical protein